LFSCILLDKVTPHKNTYSLKALFLNNISLTKFEYYSSGDIGYFNFRFLVTLGVFYEF